MLSIGDLVLNCSGAVSVPVRCCLRHLFTGRGRADCVAAALSPRKDEFWRLGTGQRHLEIYIT